MSYPDDCGDPIDLNNRTSAKSANQRLREENGALVAERDRLRAQVEEQSRSWDTERELRGTVDRLRAALGRATALLQTCGIAEHGPDAQHAAELWAAMTALSERAAAFKRAQQNQRDYIVNGQAYDDLLGAIDAVTRLLAGHKEGQ